ncbi:hypothetical protein SAMN05443575_3670 [Jatrophihabitans endophyticus]|uniref:DNA-binding transcriptional regulator of glucitol operon n=1 Tax=Jatrophihabitans endophyticus TaxID=1206085 RepID=A0A1M5RWC3_9ACTN|nr:hypothetical protein [Jatrophihabitans endophyticus]SHH30622.1 hypothetical protein SAMN05443575_3670 [Jatrophihabitans endophyticus]
MRRYAFAVRPGWLFLHLVTIALAVTMILLGRWQLTVSEHQHFNIRNFGYALQWWAFTAFTLIMWFKVVRDRVRQGEAVADVPGATAPPTVAESVAYRRYVAPEPPPVEDDTLAAYNDYLARLDGQDGRPS